MGSTQQYEKLSKLGEGVYGSVYLAKNRETNEFVAMKKLAINTNNDGMPSTVVREISLLKELSDHPNIVKLKDILYVPSKLYLIFEYVERDMRSLMDQMSDPLPQLQIKSWMYQLLKSLLHCHSHRVLHRDLKPQNILIDKTGQLKLADFNLSRIYTFPAKALTQEMVTLWYRAPEIILGQATYSTPVDIWSAGCIFAELLTKKVMFTGDSEIDQLYKIFKKLGTPTDTIWPGLSSLPNYQHAYPQFPKQSWAELFPGIDDPNALNLLEMMLQYQPEKRITAKNALQHPYFVNSNNNNTV